jgi:AraC family transcriptional regulator
MPRNSSIRRIGLVIDYVERNIDRRLSLDELSEHAGLSKFHLNRIFKALTNKQLMDYVRNRKLSRSVLDLLEADYKIIDIAMEYGFAYEQSYIRSFRRAFGVSPDRLRRERTEVRVTEKLDAERLEAVGDEGMLIEPVVLIRPAFSIVGEAHEISVREDSVSHTANRLGNDFFFNKKARVPDAKNPETYIGFIRLFPDDPDKVSYMPSVMVSSPPGLSGGTPEGMTRVDLPTQKYAAFKYIGFRHPRLVTVNEYRHIYEYIYASWFAKSAYRPGGDFRFESISEAIARDDYCEVDLYIPIKDGK